MVISCVAPMSGNMLVRLANEPMLRTWKPSSCTFESLVRPPWMVKAFASRRLLVPPTSCVCALMPVLVERPGDENRQALVAAAHGDGVDDFLLHHAAGVAFWTSTIGDSPVTVTVSVTSPTRSSTFTVALNDPVSSIPSRFTVVKPCSENGTL